MKRRTILKGIGVAAATGAGFAGSASATFGNSVELDVSGVSGEVAVADLADEGQLARLGDFRHTNVIVSAEADTIDLSSCCHHQDCCANVDNCDCSCCTCDACEQL